jgi:hypothetical protein
MKLFSSIVSGLLLTGSLATAQTDITPYNYKNFIYQTLLPGNAVMLVGVELKSVGVGEYLGVPFKPEGGSKFDLYTVRAPTPDAARRETYLGTTTIDLFTPTTELVIQSEDPDRSGVGSTAPRRTRADRPFSVVAKVAGLDTDLTKPACFRFINFFRSTQSYMPTKTEVGKVNNPLISLPSTQFTRNGTETLPYITELMTPVRRRACGEETFTAMSLEDRQLTGQVIAPRELDQKRIQVWPIPSADEIIIHWETPEPIVRTTVPKMTFAPKDLYPLSYTYVQVYRGPQKDGTQGTKIGVNYTYGVDHCITPEPTDSPANYNDYFPTDGQWIVEIVTTWPRIPAWGSMVLASTPINIDRTFRLNTNLTTSE